MTEPTQYYLRSAAERILKFGGNAEAQLLARHVLATLDCGTVNERLLAACKETCRLYDLEYLNEALAAAEALQAERALPAFAGDGTITETEARKIARKIVKALFKRARGDETARLCLEGAVCWHYKLTKAEAIDEIAKVLMKGAS